MPRTITYTVGILRGRSDAFTLPWTNPGWVRRRGDGRLSSYFPQREETRQRTRARPIPWPPYPAAVDVPPSPTGQRRAGEPEEPDREGDRGDADRDDHHAVQHPAPPVDR